MARQILHLLLTVLLGLLLIACALCTPNYAFNQSLSILLLLGILVLLHCPHEKKYRSVFLLLIVFSILRYFFWRSFVSMNLDGSVFDNISGILLYSAELYTLILLLLGIFTSFYAPEKQTAPPLPSNEDLLPRVDVLIPSYDEPIALLEATLIAAANLDYPKDKLQVYLLDDGSSDAKRNHADPVLRETAQQRYQQSTQLCQELGICLLTRKDNLHAKAGNLNAALTQTTGDLLLVLDADHVVCSDFLQKTVGFFLNTDNLAIVQTPHFFISANPVEKNLEIFDQATSENDVFYFVSQPSLDDNNATFFCGSAGLISRPALDDVGGFAEYSITEDCATSLNIHAKGYDSVYVDQPLIAALQPETIESYIRQRNRWTQGMIQIFMLDNPLFKKGLTLKQRLSYLSTTCFWFFSYGRLIFFIAPMLYLLFGFQIYRASFEELLSFVIPHLIVIFFATYYLYGGVRKIFMSGIYELFQSCSAIVALVKTLIRPRSPRFRSTPKQEIYDQDRISRCSYPFYILYALSLVALAVGLWRYLSDDGVSSTSAMMLIGFFWAAFNMFILHGVIGAFLERRQRRLFTRSWANYPLTIHLDNERINGQIIELSAQGAKIQMASLPDTLALTNFPVLVDLLIDNPVADEPVCLTAYIHEVMKINGQIVLRTEFLHDTLSQRQAAILLNYQSSLRWAAIIGKKHRISPFLASAVFLIRQFFKAFKDHCKHLIKK